jgi:ABC-type Mn2+/Zn2+ transport system ATPase subunit
VIEHAHGGHLHRHSHSQPLAVLRDVTCSYGGPVVLWDVSLRIEEGAFVGLVGPSGSGKTSLLRTLLGTMPRVQGRVSVMGADVRRGRPTGVGYVPQVETVDWSFPVTVGEVVRMGISMSSTWLPWPSAGERKAVDGLLERLGIGGLAGRHIRDLSGGQQQRVFLARALIGKPRLLLLDEPTSGIDIKTRDDVLHLLLDLHEEGLGIVLTTHELNGVAAHLPEVVALNGTVVAQGSPEEVFTQGTLRLVYGADLTVLHENGMVIIADAPHQFRAALASTRNGNGHS